MSQYHDSPEKAEDEVERTEAETDPVDDTEGPEGDGWQDDPAARINALESEVANLKDQLLRALAETENTRRRAEREREDAAKYGVAGFARDMLNVADNLARAIEAVPAEAREEDARLKSLSEGVEMTMRELATAMERHGIKRVDPAGEPFDHNFHQAMFEVDDPAQEPGTVASVLQPGYVIHDRLLRPAMVGVVKKRSETSRVDTRA